MELVFTVNRGGYGNYNYTMKIENNICTWSCDRWEVQQGMHFNNPPYNVPSYISKSIKELLEMSAIATQHFTMWIFANKLKNVLTVTLKDELDDIILHYVKELKETEIKLKESEQKLQLLQITHNDLIIKHNIQNNYINNKKKIIKKCKLEIIKLNDDISKKITELLNKNRQLKNDNLEITIENNKLKKQLEETENRLQKLNDKLKESDNTQKKDKNSRWSMLSSFFYK